VRGREFLRLATEVVQGRSEAHWRGAVIHAYYALMLECRDALARWGRSIPPRDVHRQVRLTLQYAGEQELKDVATELGWLSQARARANYDMAALTDYASDAVAKEVTQRAADALALLDAIDADPARRAAAISSLPP
jgi:hypothetical protein